MNRVDAYTFDEWAHLARVDPAAFEARRSEAIAEFLRASGAHQPLGEALQREIDAVRRRAATPNEALLEISAMLRAQLGFLGEELRALRQDLRFIERVSAGARLAGAGPQGGRR